jgi:hypothetical protein
VGIEFDHGHIIRAGIYKGAHHALGQGLANGNDFSLMHQNGVARGDLRQQFQHLATPSNHLFPNSLIHRFYPAVGCLTPNSKNGLRDLGYRRQPFITLRNPQKIDRDTGFADPALIIQRSFQSKLTRYIPLPMAGLISGHKIPDYFGLSIGYFSLNRQ